MYNGMYSKEYDTMKLFMLFYFCVNGLIIQSSQNQNGGNGAGVDFTKKPIMCSYIEPATIINSNVPELKPTDIPDSCNVIAFDTFAIDTNFKIDCNTNILKQLVQIKPVILVIYRQNGYKNWMNLLKSEHIEQDITVLINFAHENKVSGFLFTGITPEPDDLTVANNSKVGHDIIPYLKKVKSIDCNLSIGITINVDKSIILNPSVVDFDQLNSIVDFYEINTFLLNGDCNPALYNGVTPLNERHPGPGYMKSLVETTKMIKASKCELNKIYYILELLPIDKLNDKPFFTYIEVCNGTYFNTWCIQNMNDFFEKGKYLKKQNFGMDIVYINMDDINNSCCCGTFIAVTNMCEGYHNGKVKPCQNTDVQKSIDSYGSFK